MDDELFSKDIAFYAQFLSNYRQAQLIFKKNLVLQVCVGPDSFYRRF